MTDSTGQLCFGHPSQGILRWDPTLHQLIQEVGPGPEPSDKMSVFRIGEDASGRLWAASSKGLWLREPATRKWRLFTEKDGLMPYGLYGMAFLPDGSAWVHSREPQGLMRIRIEGDRLTVVEQRRKGQGLQSDLVYAVEVDEKGRTWATSDQGLDCLELHLHLGHRQGMVSEDCALLALVAEQNQIWVGTAAGLVRYEPGDQEASAPIPRPSILHVLMGGQQIETFGDALGPVPANDSTLSFRVATPGSLDVETAKIQVRLVGLETAWRDLDAPLARYPALPGGAYVFEARTVRSDGEMSRITSLEFQVRYPWWRTWWAILLWSSAAIALVLLIIRLRLAALAKSKAELEVLVAERTEELRTRNLELTEAMGRVKQLSGLLPICASCKKIRDDKGYWSQLEHYFSEHSEVGFTHGICPDCADHFFPGHGKRENPPPV
jgi:ligand-binding sensor domain-containing protein